MFRYRSIFICLLLFAYVASSDVVDGQKKKGPRRTVTEIVYAWDPKPGSAFYNYTKALPRVSRFEVSHIAGRDDQRFTEVKVFGRQLVRLSRTKTIAGDEAEDFAKIWRRQKQGTGAGCFAPAFLIRAYVEDKLYFETVICFHCHNLLLSEDGEFWGFDASGEEGKELLTGIQRLFSAGG